MIAVLLLGLLGAPVCVILLVVALVSDARSTRAPPSSRYHGQVWGPGYRTKRGRYVRGHWKRR